MTKKSLEYCSLSYLNIWLSTDRKCCKALESGNRKEKLEALKNAASAYRIARNLPSKYEEESGKNRYEPVVEILETVKKPDLGVNPVAKIKEIEKAISKQYGNRSVLSLTTKFMWLTFKKPVLIYDSQARIALETPVGDLNAFYSKWKEAYEAKKHEVAQACDKLPSVYLYSVDQQQGTKSYVEEIASSDWFRERVFDIYLWNRGLDS
ncbi:MAG: hypothetical protein KDJ31_06245 [Candidatus Competibacteraceae bacterium]|nr:hypothetical protein [Candidatus Competibacteraceae bacterium]HRY14729.1 hypothetical protein [Candidatus Competibacteraceae bacterium]